MTMQYDVKSAVATATGTVIGYRTRLKGLYVLSGGTAGNIVFRDGGGSGTTLMTIPISTNTAPTSVYIPGEGVLFSTDIHVTLPTSAAVTVFYG